MSSFDGVNSVEAVDLAGVELDVNYAIVISTNAGLWRYIVGDTVKFTSKTPYRFKITGRTKSFINVFGEELIVENADKAIARAANKIGTVVREYTVAPVFMDGLENGAHEWLIEFTHVPDDVSRFQLLLDEALRELNSDYDAKRCNNFVLGPPIIKVLNEGTFDNWLKSIGKLGGQHKVPRLSNSREIVEQILHVAASNKIEQ
jgi:hypothetical protein